MKVDLMFPKAAAPQTPKRAHILTQVGRTRSDDYAWLKDENWREVMTDPAALAADIRTVLESENAYTAAMLEHTKPLQDEIFAQMKGRLKDDDSSVPSPHGLYEYGHKYRPGDQHGIYVRSALGKPETQTVILDADALAKDAAYFDLGSVVHSDDHALLAYAVDKKGSEKYTVTLIDLITGLPLERRLENTTGDVVWGQDHATLFWVERDENERPSMVFRQNILDTQSRPEQIFKEEDPGFFVSIGKSDNSTFIEINTHNHTTSETWLLDSPDAKPACYRAREDGVEYDLHEQSDYFYILTNHGGATDFKVMRAPIKASGNSDWEPVIDHRPGTLILGLETYAGHMTRIERADALPRIVVRDMSSGKEHSIEFDEQAYSLSLSGGYEYDTHIMRFSYSSPTTPGQVFDYNMAGRERTLRKIREVPSGHNADDYLCERLSITARDGEAVPVTLIYKKGLQKDGSAPVLLYGYGSYGITIPASFRTGILSLVDRGFVYAIAHIRGGMAKGYQWYLDGKNDKKHKTFDDFVDAGNALCDLGYTSRGRLVAHGGSAGGLLVGAAVNQDPSLFAGVIAAVPFVDVLNTMSDETLPLTPPEWPEWGNPLTTETDYDRIAAYSPYDNVTERAYPAMLITGGLTDPRVTYWEPAKWAAKLRQHQTGDAPILLKINMDAGHQGESGRYESLKETAMEYAFAIEVTKER